MLPAGLTDGRRMIWDGGKMTLRKLVFFFERAIWWAEPRLKGEV